MLVLPGPGILVIIAGLAILATEYVWAERLLRMAKDEGHPGQGQGPSQEARARRRAARLAA